MRALLAAALAMATLAFGQAADIAKPDAKVEQRLKVLAEELPGWTFEPGHTEAGFRARHMMVTWVHGLFKDIHGKLSLDWGQPLSATFSADWFLADPAHARFLYLRHREDSRHLVALVPPLAVFPVAMPFIAGPGRVCRLAPFLFRGGKPSPCPVHGASAKRYSAWRLRRVSMHT